MVRKKPGARSHNPVGIENRARGQRSEVGGQFYYVLSTKHWAQRDDAGTG
jgi:hypothetical protein